MSASSRTRTESREGLSSSTKPDVFVERLRKLILECESEIKRTSEVRGRQRHVIYHVDWVLLNFLNRKKGESYERRKRIHQACRELRSLKTSRPRIAR
jgi:hypothetical protein